VLFCNRFVRVEDAVTHQTVPFNLWPCQVQIAQQLERGEWLAILKARRLGMTWLLVAFALWLVLFRKHATVVVVSQDKEYAADFLDRCRFVLDQLPDFLRRTATRDSRLRLEFNKNLHGSMIRSVACTKRAIRSLSANLIIFDEAAYMDLLKTARLAAQPAVETNGGQIVICSTSSGPSGDFYALFLASSTTKTRYTPVFFDWRARPGRDAAWYSRESQENLADPLYMKREYPATPEEAFESAEGRIYQLFSAHGESSQKFIRKIELHRDWPLYRGIDFGGVDPFVCLWGAVIPGDGPALTIDPHCANLIREMLAYHYDSSGRPADVDNHACDALRYLVITPAPNGIQGHLHIWQELYVPNSAALGLSLPDLARRITTMSGNSNHNYKCSVADRSRPDSVALLAQMGIPAIGQRSLSGGHGGEIVQGIARVNALIVGSAKGKAAVSWPVQKYVGLPAQMKRRGIFG